MTRDLDPPRLVERTIRDYEYVVVAHDNRVGSAHIYVHNDSSMSRTEIAAQLRRLANFVEAVDA